MKLNLKTWEWTEHDTEDYEIAGQLCYPVRGQLLEYFGNLILISKEEVIILKD